MNYWKGIKLEPNARNFGQEAEKSLSIHYSLMKLSWRSYKILEIIAIITTKNQIQFCLHQLTYFMEWAVKSNKIAELTMYTFLSMSIASW